jgi:hypothetical protein
LPSPRPSEWKRKYLRSVEKRGMVGTLQFAFTQGTSLLLRQVRRCLTRNPWNPVYQVLDRRYDRRWAVDTAGIDLLDEIPDYTDANAYSPVPRSTFFSVLRQIDVDYSQFVFIDFGCGKGKPVLLASELPFEATIGLELVPRLAEIGQKNIETYRGPRKSRSSQIVCADATEYEIPQKPAILYFFDPFKEDVMIKVLNNIRRSLIAVPREMYILYLDPSWRHLMDNADYLALIKDTGHCCIYKSREPVKPRL